MEAAAVLSAALPLLEGSHLGIPSGKMMMECAHLLLKAELLCIVFLCRHPCDWIVGLLAKKKNGSMIGSWPETVTQDEVLILTRDNNSGHHVFTELSTQVTMIYS